MVALLLYFYSDTVFSVTVRQHSVHKMIRPFRGVHVDVLSRAQVLENGAEFEAERHTLGSPWEVREDSILGSWEGSRSPAQVGWRHAEWRAEYGMEGG